MSRRNTRRFDKNINVIKISMSYNRLVRNFHMVEDVGSKTSIDTQHARIA